MQVDRKRREEGSGSTATKPNRHLGRPRARSPTDRAPAPAGQRRPALRAFPARSVGTTSWVRPTLCTPREASFDSAIISCAHACVERRSRCRAFCAPHGARAPAACRRQDSGEAAEPGLAPGRPAAPPAGAGGAASLPSRQDLRSHGDTRDSQTSLHPVAGTVWQGHPASGFSSVKWGGGRTSLTLLRSAAD